MSYTRCQWSALFWKVKQFYSYLSSKLIKYFRLFKYPNFDIQQALACKSFFQAEKVEYYWNPKGNCALLLTMTEVDKTGGSYYGKQGLHFIGINGQTAMVTLRKYLILLLKCLLLRTFLLYSKGRSYL